MREWNRGFAIGLAVLPILLLGMSGSAHAINLITVDTLSPSGVVGHCNLSDAIQAANSGSAVHGCVEGVGNDTIEFSVSGTISIAATLNITDANLTIIGPAGGITIDGGGSKQIMTFNGTSLTLEDLTIANGFLSGGGGGISAFGGGNLTVTGCTFFNDHAKNDTGGAILSSDALVITNSTFVGNVAQFGGAIYEANGGITSLAVTNSTFSDNFGSAEGADIASKVTPSLRGNIFANVGEGVHCAYPSVTDLGYNISDDDSCGFSGTSVNDSTTLNLDPTGLRNNGGPTETIALEGNSEAVDFIPVADCVDQSSPPVRLATDQRGFPRPDPGNLNFCDAGAFELQTTPFVLAPNSERVQIARSTTSDSDQVNMAFTFTENGFPACDAGDNAFNGFTVLLRSGSCGALDDGSLELMLEPWVVHIVNHQSYATLFQSMAPEAVLARMVQLPTPASPACGEWTVNIEVGGIDSSSLGNGPFALVLSNPDGDTGCFDITNAVVGNQIPQPTKPVVRRGARR